MGSGSPGYLLFPVTLWLLEKVINIQPQAVFVHTALCKPLYPSIQNAWVVFNPPHDCFWTQAGDSAPGTFWQPTKTRCHLSTRNGQNLEHLSAARCTLVHMESVILTWAIEPATFVSLLSMSHWLSQLAVNGQKDEMVEQDTVQKRETKSEDSPSTLEASRTLASYSLSNGGAWKRLRRR